MTTIISYIFQIILLLIFWGGTGVSIWGAIDMARKNRDLEKNYPTWLWIGLLILAVFLMLNGISGIISILTPATTGTTATQ